MGCQSRCHCYTRSSFVGIEYYYVDYGCTNKRHSYRYVRSYFIFVVKIFVKMSADDIPTQHYKQQIWQFVGMGGVGAGAPAPPAYERPPSPRAQQALPCKRGLVEYSQ